MSLLFLKKAVRGGDSVEFTTDQDTKLGYSYW